MPDAFPVLGKFRSTKIALETALIAAEAFRKGELFQTRPGKRRMSPFTCNAVTAADHFAVNNDTCTHAGTDDDPEHRAVAGTGPVCRL